MASNSSTGDKSKKKRTRNFTPADRASHRVIEKQRREALNESFLELARLLPELAQVRQLSKSIIVNGSIAHLRKLRATHLAAAPEIRSLLAERDSLLAEVNVWRSQNAQPPRPRNEFDGGAVNGILNVEQETFGTWPKGFGENGSDTQPEIEAGGEHINGFDIESQHTSLYPMTSNQTEQIENLYIQPSTFDNTFSEADMQIGYQVDHSIPYFPGEHEQFDFQDPERQFFTIPDTINAFNEGAPLSTTGFESHLFATPGTTQIDPTFNQM